MPRWTDESSSAHNARVTARRRVTPEPARRTARGEATRATILETAADLVLAQGVAGTSIDDILEASRTSKSQVYHYFADKDALVRAVIARQTERVLAAQEPHLGHLDSMDALRAWCGAIVELQRQRRCVGGCPVGSLANELAEHSDAERRLLADSFATWQSYLVTGLTTMRDRGELRGDADPELLATAFMAALQGGLLLAKTTRSVQPLEAALQMALEHVGHRSEPASP